MLSLVCLQAVVLVVLVCLTVLGEAWRRETGNINSDSSKIDV